MMKVISLPVLLKTMIVSWCCVVSVGCGVVSSEDESAGMSGDTDADGDADTDAVGDADTDTGAAVLDAGALLSSKGCAGVFNPDQMLNYYIRISESDWSALKLDQTNSLMFTAGLACEDGEEIQVGIRRKRSGSEIKPGLKVDINEIVEGQEFFGLMKLSLENGISEGDDSSSAQSLLSEYLAWRLFSRSGAKSGNAALARVHVNGVLLGVYVNVEQVDKSFLRRNVGDDTGWLWKFSGSDADGLKTNEGTTDPYLADLCFLERQGCVAPSQDVLAVELPGKLDIPQLLTVGAVNALIANTDAPILKFNNYIFYDWEGPRLYFPWDLDTAMNASYNVVSGSVPGGTTVFTDVLFTHWLDDYINIVYDLLNNRIPFDITKFELERAASVAGSAIDADAHIEGNTEDAIAALLSWWTARYSDVAEQL